MKKIFLLVLFLRVADISYSQLSEFNETIYFGNSVFGIASIFPSDSGYILAGSYNGKVGVCLIDLNCNYKWVKEYSYIPYDPTLGYFPTQFSVTNDSKYITAGTIQNGLATVNKTYLLKIDSNFNQEYLKYILEEDSCVGCTAYRHVFENSNGQYVSVGENARDSAGNFLLNKIGDGIIVITDTSGNILNYKNYGGPLNYHDWINTGLQMGNYYYLFGGTRSYAPSNITGFDRTDGWVIKTDLQGSIINNAVLGEPDINDSDFLFAFSLPNNKIITGFTKGRLYVLDENIVVEKELKIGRNVLLNDTNYAVTFFDGFTKNNIINLLCRETRFNISTYQFTSIIKIVELDLNYNIINHKYYKHANYLVSNLMPQTITSTSDKGNIFSGSVVDNSLTPVQQAWLVKTDSLGCDGFLSCNDTAMVVQIINYPDTLCKDSTYSIGVRLKGRSAPYRLYANSTLALDSIYYPYTLPLWIDTIMPVALPDTGWQNLVVTLHEPWERTASDTVQVYVRNCPTTANLTEYYKQNVVIYPNPATTELHIKIRGLIEGTYTISMYDTQGKTVDIITTKEQEKVIDISKYKQGVYWIRVLGNNVVRSEKVIIPRND